MSPQDRAALFHDAVAAAAFEEGVLACEVLREGPARAAGVRRARAAAVLGCGGAMDMALKLGWWGTARSAVSTLSRARVEGLASGRAARAVWDVLMRAGVRDLVLDDVAPDMVRAAVPADLTPVPPPAAPPAPVVHMGARMGVASAALPSRRPVRVSGGDPAVLVPKAVAFGRALRDRGLSLAVVAVAAGARFGVIGSGGWWRAKLGEGP